LLHACTIEAVDRPGNGGGSDSTAIFTDVSATNIPVDNLSGNSMDARAADIDNDGDLDLVIAIEFFRNRILINDGNGVFTDQSAERLSGRDFDTEDIAIADFDGNGGLDIFFASEDNGTNEFYLNNGDGTFSDASARIRVAGTSNAALASDIDNDGDFDILLGNNGTNDVLINDGSGFFQDQSTSRFPSQVNDITQDLALGDIDGDGDQDLLIANEGDNRLLLNTGNGFFINQNQNRLPLVGNVQETRDADLANIDGDNDLDIYFGNITIFQTGSNSQDRLLVNAGQGFFNDVTVNQLPAIALNTFDGDFFDIDRDGDFDIIAGDFGSLDSPSGNFTGSNFARVFINDGTGFYSDQTGTYFPENFSPAVVDLEIADFNNDGLTDIYVANFRSQDVLLLQQGQ
jgi:hypothetical protein